MQIQEAKENFWFLYLRSVYFLKLHCSTHLFWSGNDCWLRFWYFWRCCLLLRFGGKLRLRPFCVVLRKHGPRWQRKRLRSSASDESTSRHKSLPVEPCKELAPECALVAGSWWCSPKLSSSSANSSSLRVNSWTHSLSASDSPLSTEPASQINRNVPKFSQRYFYIITQYIGKNIKYKYVISF